MGLFGGFKAKFAKDSRVKSEKTSKKDEVVCLGYRVYSEFDNPPQYLQPLETRKPPPAIKTINSAPRPNSAPNRGEFGAASTSTKIETQIKSSPKLKKSSKKKAPQTANKHLSMTNLTLTNSNSEESNTSPLNRETSISNPNIAWVKTEPVRLRNGGVKEESRSAYVTGKTSSFNPQYEISSRNNTNNSPEVQEVQIKAPKSILRQKPSAYTVDLSSQAPSTPATILTTEENIYSDSEYDKTLTLESSKTTNKPNGYTTETVDYISATQAVNKKSSTQVATYVHTEVSNSKTKTPVNANDNSSSYYSGGYSSFNTTTRSIGSTSNHAANIFFGGDEEPEVQRPRRNNLEVVQSEEERRESAEC